MSEWEMVSSKTEVTDVTELKHFLQTRFRILEAVESSKQINSNQENDCRRSSAKSKMTSARSHAFAATGQIKCFLCKQDHTIYRCPSLLNLSILDRIKKIKEVKICKFCLIPSHSRGKCPGKLCPMCGLPHNSLLHFPRALPNKIDNDNVPSTSSTDLATNKDNDNTAALSVSIHVYAHNKNDFS